MQQLIHRLIPFVLTLDKIGQQTAHMPTEDAVDLGYADGAAEAYTAIEKLIDGYVNTSEQAKEIKALTERCNPSKVILIGDAGHYVSEIVYREIDPLRNTLGEYANVHNWAEDHQGIRRVWLEPGSGVPEAYHGFEMAREAISTCENASLTPAFNEQASCQPFLTQCPRCNNPHHACDKGKTTKLLTWVEENTSEQDKALESLRAFAEDINKNYLLSIGIN